MRRLPTDSQGLGNLRPGPALRYSFLYRLALQPIGQSPQRDNGRKAVGGVFRGGHWLDFGHASTLVDRTPLRQPWLTINY